MSRRSQAGSHVSGGATKDYLASALLPSLSFNKPTTLSGDQLITWHFFFFVVHSLFQPDFLFIDLRFERDPRQVSSPASFSWWATVCWPRLEAATAVSRPEMKVSCHSTRGAFLSRRKEFWHVRVGTFVFLGSVRKMIALSASVLTRFSQKLKRQISVWRTRRISLAIVSNIFFSLLSYIKLECKLIERKGKKREKARWYIQRLSFTVWLWSSFSCSRTAARQTVIIK